MARDVGIHVFMFDNPNAEDLITVTHSWQASSSFPMETEAACGASLQIISGVIKIRGDNASLWASDFVICAA